MTVVLEYKLILCHSYIYQCYHWKSYPYCFFSFFSTLNMAISYLYNKCNVGESMQEKYAFNDANQNDYDTDTECARVCVCVLCVCVRACVRACVCVSRGIPLVCYDSIYVDQTQTILCLIRHHYVYIIAYIANQ